MRSPILSQSPTGRAFARAAGAAVDAARAQLITADRTEPAAWPVQQLPAPRRLARLALTLCRGRGALSFRLSLS